MDNLKFFQQELTELFAKIPFNQFMGLEISHADHEHVAMQFKMKRELVGNFLLGILHGGVISTALDMAGGLLAMSNSLNRHSDQPLSEISKLIGKTSTVDLHVNYINPGLGEIFTANATLLKAGNRLCFTRMELSNEKSILIAIANGTYLLK